MKNTNIEKQVDRLTDADTPCGSFRESYKMMHVVVADSNKYC